MMKDGVKIMTNVIDQEKIEELFEAIVTDFEEWCGRANIREDRVIEFQDGLIAEEGRKYIKVIKTDGNQNTVWGFIVNVEDDKKFKYGDILMAAGYNAPARNKARGNLFTGYSIQWTGPRYL